MHQAKREPPKEGARVLYKKIQLHRKNEMRKTVALPGESCQRNGKTVNRTESTFRHSVIDEDGDHDKCDDDAKSHQKEIDEKNCP